MQIFRNRPLALAAWILALTAVISLSFSKTCLLICLSLSAIGVILSVAIPFLRYRDLRSVYRKLNVILCCLGVMIALLGSFFFFHVHYEKVQTTLEGNTTVEGIVLKRSLSAPYATLFDAEIKRVNGEEQCIRVLFETNYASALQIGDRFEASVNLRAFEDEEEKSACLSSGQLAAIVCSDVADCRILSHDESDLRVILQRWNDALSTRLFYAVGGEEGALATALLLGNRSFLSADTVLHFRRSGISHLLALSGLHVSILCGFAEGILRHVLKIPRIARAVIIPSLLLLYLAVTGFAPSTVRAVCMVLVLYLSFITCMEYDSFTALSVALAGIIAVTPYSVMDVSMWLSFVAAASIVIFLTPISKLGERWGHKRHVVLQWLIRAAVALITAVCVGLSSNLALMYLLAVIFGDISLLSFPMTMLLSIPTTLMLVLSLPVLLFPRFAVLTKGVKLFGSWMLGAAMSGSDARHAILPLPKLDALVILLILMTVLVLLAVLKIRKKRWFFLPLLLSVSVCLWTFGQIKLTNDGICMTYLQVGSGSICVFSEKGVAVAVDATDGRAPHVKAIRETLKAERCGELTELFLTRYYNMEASYLRSLATTVRLRRLHLPVPLNDADRAIALRLEEEAALHGVAVQYGGEETALTGLTVESFSYAPSAGSGRVGILFTAFCEGKRISMTNMSTSHSALMSEAQSRIGTSDILIVNRAGLTAQNSGVFEYRSDRPLTLFLEDETLKALMAPYDDRIRVISTGERVRILLRES